MALYTRIFLIHTLLTTDEGASKKGGDRLKASYLLVTAIIAISIFYLWKNNRPIGTIEPSITQKQSSSQMAVQMENKSAKSSNSNTSKKLEPATIQIKRSDENNPMPEIDIRVQKAVAAVISEANLSDWMALEGLKSELRAMDRESVGLALTREFKALTPEQARKRDIVLEIAKSLDSPHLFSIWQDVVDRKTPRFSNEAEILRDKGPSEEKDHNHGEHQDDDHATVDERIISTEQAIAIRELGQIAGESKKATKLLWTIVTTKDGTYTFTLRKQSAATILEVKPSYGFKLAAELDQDDPLREFIKNILVR